MMMAEIADIRYHCGTPCIAHIEVSVVEWTFRKFQSRHGKHVDEKLEPVARRLQSCKVNTLASSLRTWSLRLVSHHSQGPLKLYQPESTLNYLGHVPALVSQITRKGSMLQHRSGGERETTGKLIFH
ncbi:unnamed protein product [Caretta caretta]